MTRPSSIRVEMQAGLAIVNLAQPERGNPIDGDMGRDFRQVFMDLWNEPSLRAVLLRADGKNFSFGGDLKTFHPQLDKLAPLVRAWTADFHMGPGSCRYPSWRRCRVGPWAVRRRCWPAATS